MSLSILDIPVWDRHTFKIPAEWELRKNDEFVVLRDKNHELHVALPINAKKREKFNAPNLAAARNSLAMAVFSKEFGNEAYLDLVRASGDLTEAQSEQFARLKYLNGDVK